MKIIKYILPIAIFIIFSCKEKSESNTKVVMPIISEKTFEDVQKIPDITSDTIYITNYWATWCQPCVKEIPDFLALQKEYKNQKVKFLFVNVDEAETQQNVVPFIQQYGMGKVYQISFKELKKFITFNPELTQGIPVTTIQKKEEKEGFIGIQDKTILQGKIEEYLKK